MKLNFGTEERRATSRTVAVIMSQNYAKSTKMDGNIELMPKLTIAEEIPFASIDSVSMRSYRN